MLSETEISRQKSLLESEGNFVDIAAPATPEKGITIIGDQQHYIDCYDEKSKNYSIEKFVPASGAATRMFKRLIAFNNEPNLKNLHDGGDYSVKATIDALPRFAFFDTLKDSIKDVENLEEVSDKILHEPLNYAGLPKGLVEFHKYNGFSRTAFEEQIFEGVAMNNSDQPAKLEFTVSEEHYEMFKSLLDKILHKNKLNVDVKFSFQEKSTNTVAIYNDGTLVTTDSGELFTRPGGHGSLLQNLNQIDADIIFIKNIDNIVHQDYMAETLPYKKLLGGVLIETAENIKSYMQSLESDVGRQLQPHCRQPRKDFLHNFRARRKPLQYACPLHEPPNPRVRNGKEHWRTRWRSVPCKERRKHFVADCGKSPDKPCRRKPEGTFQQFDAFQSGGFGMLQQGLQGQQVRPQQVCRFFNLLYFRKDLQRQANQGAGASWTLERLYGRLADNFRRSSAYYIQSRKGTERFAEKGTSAEKLRELYTS